MPTSKEIIKLIGNDNSNVSIAILAPVIFLYKAYTAIPNEKNHMLNAILCIVKLKKLCLMKKMNNRIPAYMIKKSFRLGNGNCFEKYNGIRKEMPNIKTPFVSNRI